MKIGNATSLVTLLLGATVFSAPVFAQNTTSLKHTLVLEDLENPWDMAFLDDGTMFYTEKCKGCPS
ncbi:glucose/arabinose dehydrogenase [Labrenzia sp. EL_13]|nr:glucose/arabinose dehydrogenase [Labrenzia sp. EL_13]